MHEEQLAGKAWIAWLILAVGLLATIALSLTSKQDAEADAVQQFAYASDQITLKIRERLAAQELILRGAAGLIVGSDSVDRKEWRGYWTTLKPDLLIPGVQGFGFAQLIAPDRLEAHVAQVRAEGFPHYAVRPDGKRDTYSSIIYLEPFNDRNRRAFGYDMLSEPTRRTAMEHARDSGRATLSGKVQLVQETDRDIQAGVLMYVPVYRADMPTETLAQRKTALVGWSYSPYRMSDLMIGMLQDWQGRLGKEIHIDVYDGQRAAPASLLYSSKPAALDTVPSVFRQQRNIDFNGHPWLLVFDLEPEASNVSSTTAWFILFSGILISALLFWWLRTLLSTNLKANRIANQLTLDIRQQTQLLKDSEFRWNFALDGSGLGVWDWNIAEGTVFYSKRWKQMLGYDDNEIGSDLEEWDKRIHPDDKSEVLARLQSYTEGKTPHYDTEYRIRCKDGSYKWGRDRGTAITSSADGKPLRMIGTLSDISGQMQDIMRIQELARLNAALSECNAAIMHCKSEAQLLQRVCEVVVQFGGMKMAWIGLADPATGKITPTNACGNGTGYLDGIEISMHADDPHGQGATGTAVRENRAVWIEDFRVDPRTAPWQYRAGPYGWRSSASLPLCRNGKAIGALTFYSSEAGWYDHEMRTLLEGMAAQISFALDKLDSEAEAQANQQRMIQAGQRLQTVFEATPIPMQIHAASDFQISLINHAHQQWLGYAQEQIASLDRWLDTVYATPEEREQARSFLQRNVADLPRGVAIRAPECTLRCKDGSLRIGQSTMTVVDDDIIIAWTDLTEIRDKENVLRESERRFRTMVEQTVSSMYVRRDGKFIYVNPSFCEMIGRQEQELLGHATLEFSANNPAQQEQILQASARLDAGEKNVAMEGAIYHRDGAVIEMSIRASTIDWDDGLPAVIGIVQDITARKRAEEQIARYVKQLEDSMHGTLRAISSMVELRDPYTAGHERRVGLIAAAIAREMGWPRKRCEDLEMMGLVHDIGKIAVPAEILTKPTRLSNLEMEIVKCHAQTGYEILKDVEFAAPVAEIIRQHHERMDGSGYPRGLKGDEILPEARVLAVADVIESMAAHRPYRPALGLDVAVAEVERGKGTLYDTEVVDAILRMIREQAYVLPQ